MITHEKDSNSIQRFKFADDTYLRVPEECTTTSEDELQHIQDLAQGCNLPSNRKKTKEIIFRAKGRRDNSTQPPAACPGIELKSWRHLV